MARTILSAKVWYELHHGIGIVTHQFYYIKNLLRLPIHFLVATFWNEYSADMYRKSGQSADQVLCWWIICSPDSNKILSALLGHNISVSSLVSYLPRECYLRADSQCHSLRDIFGGGAAMTTMSFSPNKKCCGKKQQFTNIVKSIYDSITSFFLFSRHIR